MVACAWQLYTDSGTQAVVAMSSPAQYIKSAYLKHGLGVVRKEWNGLDVVRVPVTDAFGLALGCRASVVPMRQFSETRSVEPGEDSSTFYLFDGLHFADLSDGGRPAQASCTVKQGLAEPRDLPGVVVNDAPRDDPDLHDKVGYAYLQRSLEDEADVLLRLACGSGGAGSNPAAGAPQAPPWIDGGDGSLVEDRSRPPTASALTCNGLDAAKKKIVGHGFDANHLVCYTTVEALRDLSSDPKFDKWSRAMHGVTEDCMREYNGILLVSRPSLPTRSHGGDAKELAPSRSVMFVPGASFGLVYDDLVTVSEEWQDDSKLRFSATHRAGGVLKNAESVCCLLHR